MPPLRRRGYNQPITQQPKQLLNQAMQLPAGERELLTVELMAHLQDSGEPAVAVEAAWHAEVARRIADSDRGSNPSAPLEEAWPRITS